MGHERNVKLIRKQLKNVVQTLLPSLVTEEMKSEMHAQLAKEVQQRLDNVTENVKSTLQMVDERSKDIQSYLIRQTTQPAEVAKVSAEDKKD